MGAEDLSIAVLTPDDEYWAEIAATCELPESERQAARDRAFAAAPARQRRHSTR